MNKIIKHNLKHGYVFLIGIFLVLFGISLCTEIYLKGGFNRAVASKEKNTESSNLNKETDLFIELIGVKDGFTTSEKEITVVAKTNKDNQTWINGNEVKVNDEGIFEQVVDLVVGKNEVILEVRNNDDKKSLTIWIIREKEFSEVSPVTHQKEDENTNKSEQTPKPNVPPVEHQEPSPELPSQPDPVPNSITGLKLSCSITNSRPSAGQQVSLDCLIKDQNNNAVSGATGNVIVNWNSGKENYSMPNSSSNGTMKISFTVPEENQGNITGTIKVSKDGLTAVSNFSIIVQ